MGGVEASENAFDFYIATVQWYPVEKATTKTRDPSYLIDEKIGGEGESYLGAFNKVGTKRSELKNTTGLINKRYKLK